jgi:hypothetical protein
MNVTLDELVASIAATNDEWKKYMDILDNCEDGLFGHIDEEELLDKLTDAYDDAEEYDSIF